jgi:hypothetical protein
MIVFRLMVAFFALTDMGKQPFVSIMLKCQNCVLVLATHGLWLMTCFLSNQTKCLGLSLSDYRGRTLIDLKLSNK